MLEHLVYSLDIQESTRQIYTETMTWNYPPHHRSTPYIRQVLAYAPLGTRMPQFFKLISKKSCSEL